MKRRKQQDDRYLKLLSRTERRKQEAIRKQLVRVDLAYLY